MERWLLWKIGDVHMISICEDPWFGYDEKYKLTYNIINTLMEGLIYYFLGGSC
jgi:hypothetical protein